MWCGTLALERDFSSPMQGRGHRPSSQRSKDWERMQRQCDSTARNDDRGERQVPQRAGSGRTPTEDG
eukprot:gene17786-biopygen9898